MKRFKENKCSSSISNQLCDLTKSTRLIRIKCRDIGECEAQPDKLFIGSFIIHRIFWDKTFQMKLIVSLCLMLFALNCVWSSENEPYKPVETHDGIVRGVRKYTLFRNVSYHAFLGIPYAEKPIDTRRFKVCYFKRNFHVWNWIIVSNWRWLHRHQHQLLHGSRACTMHSSMVILAYNKRTPSAFQAPNPKIACIWIFSCQVFSGGEFETSYFIMMIFSFFGRYQTT